MATLNMYWYGRGVEAFKNGSVDWESDTINVALLVASHTPDQGTHQFFDDVSADETSGDGYTAGGQALANKTLTYDSTGLHVTLDADNVTWDPSTISAQYAVIYKTGTAGTDDFLIAYGDAGSEQSSENDAFSIEWNADGILRSAATAQA